MYIYIEIVCYNSNIPPNDTAICSGLDFCSTLALSFPLQRSKTLKWKLAVCITQGLIQGSLQEGAEHFGVYERALDFLESPRS